MKTNNWELVAATVDSTVLCPDPEYKEDPNENPEPEYYNEDSEECEICGKETFDLIEVKQGLYIFLCDECQKGDLS